MEDVFLSEDLKGLAWPCPIPSVPSVPDDGALPASQWIA